MDRFEMPNQCANSCKVEIRGHCPRELAELRQVVKICWKTREVKILLIGHGSLNRVGCFLQNLTGSRRCSGLFIAPIISSLQGSLRTNAIVLG
jgi:hypothetical protein